MDSMDNFRERFEALEQQTEQLQRHTRTVEQRLRWWRGIAHGVVLLSLLSLALPSGKAADGPGRGMDERIATLESKLSAITFDAASNEVVITGANLRIVNGLGTTNCADQINLPIPGCDPNGLGNLIVGYNELRPERLGPNVRTGSHNVVVGKQHNFSSFGGLVVGDFNEIGGELISGSVTGGLNNKATGRTSVVSGGLSNTASGPDDVVSGGIGNTASGGGSTVSGGEFVEQTIGSGWAAGSFGSTISGRFVSP